MAAHVAAAHAGDPDTDHLTRFWSNKLQEEQAKYSKLRDEHSALGSDHKTLHLSHTHKTERLQIQDQKVEELEQQCRKWTDTQLTMEKELDHLRQQSQENASLIEFKTNIEKDLRSELNKSTKEAHDQRERIHVLENENTRQKDDILGLKKQRAENITKMQQLEAELHDIKLQYSHLDTDLNKEKEQKEELQKSYEDLTKELQRYQEELPLVKQENKKLKADISATQDEAKTIKTEALHCKEEAALWTKRLAEDKVQRQKLLKRLQELQEEIQSLQEKSSNEQASNIKLEHEKQSLEDDLHDTKASLRSTRKQYKDLVSSYEMSENKGRETDEKLVQADKSNAESKIQVDTLTREATELQSKITNLENALKELQSEKEVLALNVQEVTDQLRKSMKNSEECIATKDRVLQEAQEKLGRQKAFVERLKEDAVGRQAVLEEQKGTINNLNEQGKRERCDVKAKDRLVSQVRTEVGQCKQQIEQMAHEAMLKDEQLASMECSHKELAGKLAGQVEIASDLQETIHGLEYSIELKNSNIAQHCSDMEKLKGCLQDKDREVRNLQAMNAKMTVTIDQLKQRELSLTMQDELTQKKNAACQEVVTLKLALERAQKKSTEQNEEVERKESWARQQSEEFESLLYEKGNLSQQLVDREATVKKLKQCRDELQQELCMVRESDMNNREKLAEYEVMTSRSERDIEQLRDTVAQLESELSEKQVLLEEERSERCKFQAEVEHSSEQLMGLTRCKDEADTKLEHLGQMLAEKEMKGKHLEEKLQQLEKANRKHLDELMDANKTTEEKREALLQLEETKRKLEYDSTNMLKKVPNLEQMVTQHQTETKHWKEVANTTSETLQQLQTKNYNLTNEVETRNVSIKSLQRAIDERECDVKKLEDEMAIHEEEHENAMKTRSVIWQQRREFEMENCELKTTIQMLQDKVCEHNRNTARLENKLKQTETSLEREREKNESLKNTLKQLREKVSQPDQNSKTLLEVQRSLWKAENEVLNLRHDYQKADEQLKVANKEIKKLSTQGHDYNMKLASEVGKNETFQTELNMTKERLKTMAERANKQEELYQEIHKKTAVIAQMQESEKEQKDTMSKLNEDLVKSKDLCRKLEWQESETKQQANQAERKVASLEHEVAELKKLITSQQETMMEKAKELDDMALLNLELEIASQQRSVGTAQEKDAEISRLKYDITNLEGLCEDRTGKCDDQAEQIKRIEEELKKKEEELMKKEEELMKKEEELMKKEEEFERKEIVTVQQYSEEAKQKKIKYEQEIAMKNETIENCEKEIKGLKDDVSNLRRMLEDSSRKCDEHASVVKNKEEELEQKEKDLREMKDKHDEEIRRMRDATENRERDHSVLQAELDGMTKQLEYIAAKYPQQEENLTEKQAEITEKEEEIKDLTMKIAEMKEESKLREARLGQTNDTMSEKEESLAEREREVARLQEEFKQQEQTISEKEVLIASLKEESGTLTLKNKELDASLREKLEEIGKLREELESSQKWCQSLKSINQELQMKESGENVMKESKQQNPHTEPFENVQQYQKDHEKIFKEKQSCEVENLTLKAEVDNLETEIKNIRTQNKEFKGDVDKLTKEKLELQRQLNQRPFREGPNRRPVATPDQYAQKAQVYEKSSTTWYARLENSVEVGEEADDFEHISHPNETGTQTDAELDIGEVEKAQALGQERASELIGEGALAKMGDICTTKKTEDRPLQRSHPPIHPPLLPGRAQQVFDSVKKQGDGNLENKWERKGSMEDDEKKLNAKLVEKLMTKGKEIAKLEQDMESLIEEKAKLEKNIVKTQGLKLKGENDHLKSFRNSASCVQQWLKTHGVFHVVVPHNMKLTLYVKELTQKTVTKVNRDLHPMATTFLTKGAGLHEYNGRLIIPILSSKHNDVKDIIKKLNIKETRALVVMFNVEPSYKVDLPTTDPLHPAVYIQISTNDQGDPIMDTEDNQKAVQRMREVLVEKVEISYDALSTFDYMERQYGPQQ